MYGVYDIIGLIGAALIIVAYLLLQTNKLKLTTLVYSLLNAIGAGLIIISLVINWNLASFIIEVFWLLISIFGLIKYFTGRKKTIQ